MKKLSFFGKKKILEHIKLIHFQKSNFSYIYNNHPIITEYNVNGKLKILDNNKGYYNSFIDNLLNKKFTEKHEVIEKLKLLTEGFESSLLFNSNINNSIPSNGVLKFQDTPDNELKIQFQSKNFNKNYLHCILLTEDEHELLKFILQNVILNGRSINFDDWIQYSAYKEKVDDLVDVFFNGDKLTEEENITRMIYLTQKYKKFKYYKQHRYKEYACIFTEKDYVNFLPISFSQELHINKSIFLSDNKFYNKYNINLKPVNMDLLFQISENMKIKDSNLFLKYFYYFFKNNHLLNNVIKSEMIAYCILAKINFILLSEEFNKEFDSGFDFYIGNAILSMHIWLICQRLNNFKRSKNSYELVNNIIKLNNKICNSQFQNVDTLRKISKYTRIEENAEEQKKKLHWHFQIYNPTVENNFFKIDSLVWTYIFKEKIDRHDDRVYKMSHYIIYHYNKFKELNYLDFKNLTFTFDLHNSIPVNYKDTIKKYNQTLTKNQLFLENYNNFTYRVYVYSYKTEFERKFENLYKTFVRYTTDQTFDKKTFLMMSRRKEDDLYDVLKDEDKINELESNLNLESNSTSINIFRNIFNIWSAKYFDKNIEICEKEDRLREMGEYVDFREIKKGVMRFSENLHPEMKKKLYKFRYNLHNNPKSDKDIYILHETKILYPDANVINKKRRDKNFVEKIFKL